jgi:hypothetical protein
MGGNKKAKEFFESQPDYLPSMPLPDKYNSHFATMYREKVRKIGWIVFLNHSVVSYLFSP